MIESLNANHPVTAVIGLEVHVQLKTATKLFCSCSTEFGAAPNTQVCPVCLGMPGALPVLNAHAAELSVRAGLAINCEIPESSKWDRKQYFYPDSPKGYQISQFDAPICAAGFLAIQDPEDETKTRRIGITRAHLEEDAGKSMHDEQSGRGNSRIDLNRCGTPLLEIVSEPDMRSSAEAKAYLEELKLVMIHIGVSDCEMQQGSLRVDANVNLHIDTRGETIATPIVEVKNMNSFRAVERAIDFEIERQYLDWEDTGKTIADEPKTTRGWDDGREATFIQREKEESADYRYFPDPDLLPLHVSRDDVDRARGELGELPAQIRDRLCQDYGLKPYDADVIVNQGSALITYFESAAKSSGDGKRTSSWIQQDVLRALKDGDQTIERFAVSAESLGELVGMVSRGQIDTTRGRDVFLHMRDQGVDASAAIQALGIQAVDGNELEQLCRELLEKNPQVVADVRDGKTQAVGALIGQAKKQNPNANPKRVRETLLELIESA